MRIIVDSNILFSAILNTNSRIGQILLFHKSKYRFIAPGYARDEILEHKGKIQRISGFSSEEFFEVYELITKNLSFLDHSIVPQEYYERAFTLCKDIDIDDTVFVAFSEFHDAKIWTGDKKLINGLFKKEFDKIITTGELFRLQFH